MKKIITLAILATFGLSAFAVPEEPVLVTKNTEHALSDSRATKVTANVKLVYDETLLYPLRVEALRKESGQLEKVSYGTKSVKFQLEPDTYDFHFVLQPYQQGVSMQQQMNFYDPYTHVFVEDVKVEDGIEVTLDAGTATNLVHFAPVDLKGEEFRHVKIKDQQLDYTDTNIFFETLSLQIYNKNYGEIEMLYGTSSHVSQTGKKTVDAYDFYINDVSDKFVFTQSILAVNTDNNLLALMLGITGPKKGNKTISNTASDYTFYKEMFELSPSYNDFPHDLYRSGMNVYVNVNKLQTRSFNHLTAYTYPQGYFCFKGTDKDMSYEFNIHPKVFELDDEIEGETDKRNQYITYGCPVTMSPDGSVYTSDVNNYFKWNKIEGVMGDNVPITMLIMHQVKLNDKTAVKYAPQFVGRYGEKRESDIASATVEVCYNGTPVCTKLSELNTWAETWANDNHTPGKMTAKFTNTNCKLDGIDGKSVLEIEYTEGKNDMCAPATQMLVFTDNSGLVKNIFESTDGKINIEFSAGDPRGNGSRYSYMDAWETKLEYAPHGTNDFAKLDVKTVKGATSTTNWTVYGSSIASASNLKGLYDVRITLKDSENNTSVQTISPAFKVNNFSGVEDITDNCSKHSIECDGSKVTLHGFESPVSHIFNVNGQHVMEAHGSEYSIDALPSGLYIVAIEGEMFKIIKR